MTVRARITGACVGSSKPNAASRFWSPIATSTPTREPEHRREESDDECLRGHRSRDLFPGRAAAAEQRQLPRALGDDDRERVVDDEGADEQRDEREHQEERVEEAEPILHVAGLLRPPVVCR